MVRDAFPQRRRARTRRWTFQAIRMEVNREALNLADGLDESVHLLGPEAGCCAAYHSSRTGS